MALADGMVQVDDVDIAYAEGVNQLAYGHQGNAVMNGLKAVPDAPVSLSIDTETGYFISGTIPKKQVANTISLSGDVPGTPGESVFVYIYFTSGGVLTKLAGTPVATGGQFPPPFTSIPDDAILLARVLLTNGDSVINASQIKDLRLFNPPVDIIKSTAVDAESIRQYHDANWGYLDLDSGLGSGFKIRGATSSPYVSMVDKFIFELDGSLNLPLHNLSAIGLKLAGTLVTASAAELNLLDGRAIGIVDTNLVQINSSDVAIDRYARFTSSGLDGRTIAEVLTDIGITNIGSGIIISELERTGLHSKYNSTNLEVDLGLTVAQLLDGLAYGAANATWRSCSLVGSTVSGSVEMSFSSGIAINPAATGTGNVGFVPPLENNRGALKLYITGMRIAVVAAGVNDKLTDITMYGIAAAGGGTYVIQDAGGRTTPGNYEYTFTAEDMSSYASISIHCGLTTATKTNLKFRVAQVQYYYA